MTRTASRLSFDQDITRFSERIDRLGSAMDVHDYLRSTAAQSGFRHFAIVRFSVNADDSFARQIQISSLPQSVIRDCERDVLAAGVGLMTSARRSMRPFIWNRPTSLCHRAGNDNPRNGPTIAPAGVAMGVGLPVSSWRAVRGLVLFGGERSLPDLAEIARLSLLANCLFDRLVEIAGEEPSGGDARLTERERQCLTWTSAGKTSAEIAAILGLSEHTINQYITASGQKLGAVNRTQAVAKAIRLRLID